ncbi:MAG TPA: DUF294 nucleotidyltransferase-like domain-containing protein, partial [Methylomirabilota bacterium]|nr:DUF294 nucleotidyltransferase-like domain-containing protein [Methylomirabilota bacterium]
MAERGPAGAGIGELALFVSRVRDLMTAPALTCRADTPISTAAALMTHRGIGSLIVVADSGAPIGIVTDRDLRSKVVARDRPTTDPVAAIMSAPLISIEADQMALDALLEMTRRSIHHLAVTESERLRGVVSSHDLTRLPGAHPVALAREIEDQVSIEGLAKLASRQPDVVRWLVKGGAAVFDIGRIVAELNDRLVRRTLDLTGAALEAEGLGRPPVAYTWLAAGSEGRREQTLKTDQDNGLVYDDPPEELAAEAGAYFARLAGRIGEALVSLGFPACDGGFMASNPRWCRPWSTWRDYFAGWMGTPDPEDIL